MNAITNLTAAQLSQAAYKSLAEYKNNPSAAGMSLPMEWAVDTELSYSVTNKTGGVDQFLVFVNQNYNQVVIAFKGAENIADWTREMPDKGFGYSAWRELSAAAVTSYAQIVEKYKGYSVVTDGHSMGGGLAQTFALEAGLDCYAQNSLPISPETIANDFPLNGKQFVDVLADWKQQHTLSAVSLAGDLAAAWFTNRGVYLDAPPTKVQGVYSDLVQIDAAAATELSNSYLKLTGVSNWLFTQLIPYYSHNIDTVVNALSLPTAAADEPDETLLSAKTVITANADGSFTATAEDGTQETITLVSDTANKDVFWLSVNNRKFSFNALTSTVDTTYTLTGYSFGAVIDEDNGNIINISKSGTDKKTSAQSYLIADKDSINITSCADVTIFGNADKITATDTAVFTVRGNDNTITLAAGDRITLSGTANTVTATGCAITFDGLGSSAALSGTNDIVILGNQYIGIGSSLNSNLADISQLTYLGSVLTDSGATYFKLTDGTQITLQPGSALTLTYNADESVSAMDALVNYLNQMGAEVAKEDLAELHFAAAHPTGLSHAITGSVTDSGDYAAVTYTADAPGAIIAGQQTATVTRWMQTGTDENNNPIYGYQDVSVPTKNYLSASGDLSRDTIQDIQVLSVSGASVQLTAEQFNGFDTIEGYGTLVAATGGNFTLAGKSGGAFNLTADSWEGTTLVGGDQAACRLTASKLGNDLLIAGNGARNYLNAGQGADTLLGGNGGDIFSDGAGSDVMVGGTGDDLFYIRYAQAGSTITGGGGNDTLCAPVGSSYYRDISDLTFSGITTLEVDLLNLKLTADQFASVSRIVNTSPNTVTLFGTTGGTYDLSAHSVTGNFAFAVDSDEAVTVIGSSANSQTISAAYRYGDNTLTAGSGNSDTINVAAAYGNNNITFGDGKGDSLFMEYSYGANTVAMGNGDNDTVDAKYSSGNNTIRLGDGDKAIVYLNNSSGNNTVTLGDGTGNVVDARSSSGFNTMHSGKNDTTLYAGYKIGSMTGGEGDDTLVLTNSVSSGGAAIDGGAGINTLIVNQHADISTAVLDHLQNLRLLPLYDGGDVSVDLTAEQYNSFDHIYASGSTTIFCETGGTYSLAGKEISGTVYMYAESTADITLIGNNEENQQLWGSGGNDTLIAGNGANDYLYGDSGNDILIAGNGGDTLNGVSGKDTLTGGTGSDWLFGGYNYGTLDIDGNDVLIGGGGDDTLSGHSGDSYYFSGAFGHDCLQSNFSATETLYFEDMVSFEATITVSGKDIVIIIGKTGENSLRLLNAGIYGVECSFVFSDGVKQLSGNTWGAPVTDAAELLTGTAGNDLIDGHEGDDTLYGLGGSDTLYGGSGADILDGGAGSDKLYGGAGDDRIIYDAADTAANVSGGQGSDILDASQYSGSLAINLASRYKDFESILGGSGADSLTGNAAANLLSGGAGNDTLSGGAGFDILLGGEGNDFIFYDGTESAANLSGGTGDDTLSAETLSKAVNLSLAAYADIENLIGGKGNDTIVGNASANVLSGGAGADTLSGGAGDDIFLVDNIRDVVVEGESEGTDTVKASVSYLLGANVENLAYTGKTAFRGTGNSLANTIRGGSGADTLDGGAGADTLDGGAGSDLYLVDDSGDCIIDNAGIDTVQTTLAAYTLSDDIENLTYIGKATFAGTGNSLANILTGGSGADILDGGAGSDKLYGGAGDDRIMYDAADAAAYVSGGQGSDTLDASQYSGNLAINLASRYKDFESILGGSGADSLTGNAAANLLSGGAGNDTLSGGAGFDILLGGEGNDFIFYDGTESAANLSGGTGDDTLSAEALSKAVNLSLAAYADFENLIGGKGNDTIVGNASANVLRGGAGADTLIGGAGDDIFLVDNIRDVVVEGESEGTDTVKVSVSYILGANVENLAYTGKTAFRGTGNSLANTIRGGSGADTLDGGAGADTLDGGAGSDLYLVDDSGDCIIDSAGIDTVQTTLAAYTLSNDIENLTYIGKAAFAGTGNSLSNILTGGSGADNLDGGAGSDKLYGGAGDDRIMYDAADAAAYVSGGQGSDTLDASQYSGSLAINLASRYKDFESILGGSGADSLTGNALANVLSGGAGNDTLSGGAGNDTLLGDDSNDYLSGGNGDDFLMGGSGNDTLIGGSGNDVYYFAPDWGNDVIVDTANAYNILDFGSWFSPNETLHAKLSSGNMILFSGNDSILDTGESTINLGSSYGGTTLYHFGSKYYALAADGTFTVSPLNAYL